MTQSKITCFVAAQYLNTPVSLSQNGSAGLCMGLLVRVQLHLLLCFDICRALLPANKILQTVHMSTSVLLCSAQAMCRNPEKVHLHVAHCSWTDFDINWDAASNGASDSLSPLDNLAGGTLNCWDCYAHMTADFDFEMDLKAQVMTSSSLTCFSGICCQLLMCFQINMTCCLVQACC